MKAQLSLVPTLFLCFLAGSCEPTLDSVTVTEMPNSGTMQGMGPCPAKTADGRELWCCIVPSMPASTHCMDGQKPPLLLTNSNLTNCVFNAGRLLVDKNKDRCMLTSEVKIATTAGKRTTYVATNFFSTENNSISFWYDEGQRFNSIRKRAFSYSSDLRTVENVVSMILPTQENNVFYYEITNQNGAAMEGGTFKVNWIAIYLAPAPTTTSGAPTSGK